MEERTLFKTVNLVGEMVPKIFVSEGGRGRFLDKCSIINCNLQTFVF